jgi:UDP-2,3-diacylglucosamine hydrolase
MTTLFVSDLHLHPSRPEVTDCFLEFLKEAVETAEALYILGDLFEVWVGDDDPEPHNRMIIDALQDFSDPRRPCYFLRGNRDVLIGRRFCTDASVQLIAEPTVIDLYGERALIMHGDELCTDDHAYQKFRRRARSTTWRALFLALPLALRRRIAAGLRNRSTAITALKPEEITDVSQTAVDDAMREHRVTTLLHGHTHRPGIHDFRLDGRPATRIVLGDWYEQGSVLHWGPEHRELRSIPLSDRIHYATSTSRSDGIQSSNSVTD